MGSKLASRRAGAAAGVVRHGGEPAMGEACRTASPRAAGFATETPGCAALGRSLRLGVCAAAADGHPGDVTATFKPRENR